MWFKWLMPLWTVLFWCLVVDAHPTPTLSLVRRDTCGPNPVLDCEQFSATGVDPSQHLCCREYLKGKYPRTIGGRRVDLYRYTEGWNPNDQTVISHLAAIGDALENVLPVYEDFGVDFDLIVIYSKTLPKIDGDAVDGYEQEKVGTSTPCYVRLQDADEAALQRTVAHELYHCVEDANRQAEIEPLPPNNWWVEGLPEFFSAEFYPDHGDSAWPRQYDPTIPLFRQSYAASLFFIFLDSFGWHYDKFNDLAFNAPLATSFAAARSQMSANGELTGAFPFFAQAFADDTITYSDGSLVKALNVPGVVPEPFPLPKGGSNNRVVRAKAFVPYQFALSLDAGQSFDISWKPTSKDTSMFYRNRADTEWIDITVQGASLEVSCDDNPPTYDFLFTCTADVAEAAGVLSIVQTDLLDCCDSKTATASSCTTPVPTPTPTPTPSGGDGPDCLRGNWKLDNAALQKTMQQAVSSSGATVSNLKVTGSSTFAVDADTGTTGKWTFSHLDVDYDLAVEGITAHTLIDIDGTSTATIKYGSDGSSFVFQNPQSSGQVKTTTTTSLDTDPIELDFDIGDQYGPDVGVTYTCSATALVMTGTQSTTANGVSAGTWLWTWSFTKA